MRLCLIFVFASFCLGNLRMKGSGEANPVHLIFLPPLQSGSSLKLSTGQFLNSRSPQDERVRRSQSRPFDILSGPAVWLLAKKAHRAFYLRSAPPAVRQLPKIALPCVRPFVTFGFINKPAFNRHVYHLIYVSYTILITFAKGLFQEACSGQEDKRRQFRLFHQELKVSLQYHYLKCSVNTCLLRSL